MEKKDKLEILVVEDTPENLAVAKEYFDSQEDLVFDYVTCRDEAFSMLDNKKYDGVITDRSIPGIKNENLNIEENKDTIYAKNNGWLIMLKSVIDNIPWVMHTEHGFSRYFFQEGSFLGDRETLKEIFNHYSNYDLNKFYLNTKKTGVIDAIEKTLDKKTDFYKGFLCENDFAPGISRKDLTKQNPESWEVALDYLKQRILSKD